MTVAQIHPVKGYQIIEPIGRGAASEVYKARQLKSGQIVALKVVRRDHPGAVRQFKQIANEYRIAKDFTHPNLVRLYDLVTDRMVFWRMRLCLAMEYVPGNMLHSGEKFTRDRMIFVYRRLADALDYIHQHGYVHLDMKPHNVILTDGGEPKIIDFGICSRRGRTLGRVQGTPDFMAPEQLNKGWVDERTDVFNLGATMFTILTGRSIQMTLTSRVGNNGNTRVTSETFHAVNIDIPEGVMSLILECCRPSPLERPYTMQHVIERLDQLAQLRPRADNGPAEFD